MYVTLGVVLAFHASTTFDVPVPENVGATLLTLLANVTLPAAVPGEPDAGAKVTLAFVL